MLASAESGLSTEMASNGKLVGGHDDKPWDFGVGPRLKMFRQPRRLHFDPDMIQKIQALDYLHLYLA